MSASTAPGAARHRFVPPPPPRTPKAAGTRRRLLDLAARQFIERGYSAVSMNDIATAADLTKGALYGHFRSKGQLLVEVIRWKHSEREQEPDFVATLADPERGLELMYDSAGRDIRLLDVDAAAAARHDPDIAAGLEDIYRERHAWIRDAITGVSDPDTAVWLLFALSAGIGMQEAVGSPLPDTDRLRAALRTTVDSLGRG
ncbi:TetR/AcrR family transcriptional regulator [Nocardia sp. alder85J]|uniref:TetR/AcrR family transcriptional regulator n=1 Tax=Nocardia sp. alder85J TaxID=2862949 RepID=UPI001CD44130|nr:TetR/AcrR family transcriptional regulator [Nocardia sp. alder85J]MCX4098363.1 TetR/AcrR family transcriptional regulator [Nocardia sp. alder85J]